MATASLLEVLPEGRSHALCRRCGGEIPSTRRRGAVYCSDACRQQTNREKWKQRHPEKHREAQQRYRDANREACNERVRAWAQLPGNLERKKESERAWLDANRAHVNAQASTRRRRERELDPARAYLKKKAQHLWSNYRLRMGEYFALLEAQENRCAICGLMAEDFEFHVDHDHTTGAVRALLCKRCNPMIGLALENPATLRAAAAYLEGGT